MNTMKQKKTIAITHFPRVHVLPVRFTPKALREAQKEVLLEQLANGLDEITELSKTIRRETAGIQRALQRYEKFLAAESKKFEKQ